MTENPASSRLLRRAAFASGAVATTGVALTATLIAGVSHVAIAKKASSTSISSSGSSKTSSSSGSSTSTTSGSSGSSSNSTGGITSTNQNATTHGGSNGS